VPTDRAQREAEGSAFRAGPPRERTPLRDNLESIALAIILVLLVRQVVAEPFKIRHGSMAPTLLGQHMEVRCPNCGWTFNVGRDKATYGGMVRCPNDGYQWPGLSRNDALGRPLRLKWPGWLWNAATVEGRGTIRGPDIANRVPRGEARIFVNKLVYRVRKPRRWEVVVFIFPVYDARCKICGWQGHVRRHEGARCPECGAKELEIEAKNYIKRLVGLPGEEVSIRNGDVYINGKISRKPPDVQSEVWIHVFDSFFMPRREQEPLWDLGGSARSWTRDPQGGVLMVDARGALEPVMAAFARHIRDYYPYDGIDYPMPNEVGDCRIQARVRVLDAEPGGGQSILSIEDDGHVFELRVGTGARARVVLTEDGVPVRQNLLEAEGRAAAGPSGSARGEPRCCGNGSA